jgi:ADP-ribose pyrophosphatase YjhB (NUDIX family)
MGTDKKTHGYPRPTVAVDTALLTLDLERRQLVVAQMWRDDIEKWALPGTFVRQGETLADAVQRGLRDKLGVRGIRPRQLYVFDDPDRDDRDWVISVAHLAVVRPEQVEELGSGSAGQTRFVSVDRPGALAWDHPAMVRLAKQDIRERYRAGADPEQVLAMDFTLRELQRVHEAVAGEELDRDRFRRTMEHLIVRTGETREHTGSRGRPAELFRRKR